ncbi:testis-specific serine/threonine-protein kinase 1-like [Phlebotomus argentipes]|uniref:testis-specific serine/threonine-protein kinase 1-like n=1 Tax=Phlebotomus argentipes TaxID=94469 RepID=UPI0028936F90|nr:testis-specific serine/threonine-protein kinase 1-like [Phlebotomus argentipes]
MFRKQTDKIPSESLQSRDKPLLTEAERQIFQQHDLQVDALLSMGAFSRVYRASCLTSNPNQALAIKVVDMKMPSRFQRREVEILQSIQHPFIVCLHSVFTHEQQCFIVTEMAEAGDLLDFLLRHGPIRENRAKKWTKELSQALNYLHARDIVHRDLKCENILLTKQLHVQLADFGFAKRLTADDELSRGYSETYCGSLAYAAPEILLRQPYLSKPADLWSLGVILFVLLNARLPFHGTLRAIRRQQMRRCYKFRRCIRYRLTAAVRSLVRNLLRPNASRRFTIAEVLNSQWLNADEAGRSEASG